VADCCSGSEARDSGLGRVSLSTVVPLGNGFASGDFPAPKVQLELDREFDLQLDRSAKVLLGPKLNQESRDPLPYRKEAMDLGVAGGAQT
jgi:hypothetical protein